MRITLSLSDWSGYPASSNQYPRSHHQRRFALCPFTGRRNTILTIGQPCPNLIGTGNGRPWTRKSEKQKIILPKLRLTMAYAYEKAPLYRRKWDQAGLRPEDTLLKGFSEGSLPFLRRRSTGSVQHPPLGRYSPPPIEDIQRFSTRTSGTTGRPTAFRYQPRGYGPYRRGPCPHMWGFGARPRDIIFIGSFFSLYMGSWGALAGGERLGAVCFPFGAGVPGQTDRAIELDQRDEAHDLLRNTLYSLLLADRCRDPGSRS